MNLLIITFALACKKHSCIRLFPYTVKLMKESELQRVKNWMNMYINRIFRYMKTRKQTNTVSSWSGYNDFGAKIQNTKFLFDSSSFISVSSLTFPVVVVPQTTLLKYYLQCSFIYQFISHLNKHISFFFLSHKGRNEKVCSLSLTLLIEEILCKQSKRGTATISQYRSRDLCH